MLASPFGAYLREARVASGKSLREVADALSISHVYFGEVERGKRRILPRKYWKLLAKYIPGISIDELEELATVSEPLDPSAFEGSNRDIVVALARTLDEGISEDLAAELLRLLQNGKSYR